MGSHGWISDRRLLEADTKVQPVRDLVGYKRVRRTFTATVESISDAASGLAKGPAGLCQCGRMKGGRLVHIYTYKVRSASSLDVLSEQKLEEDPASFCAGTRSTKDMMVCTERPRRNMQPWTRRNSSVGRTRGDDSLHGTE